jgi:hypothetical protein
MLRGMLLVLLMLLLMLLLLIGRSAVVSVGHQARCDCSDEA